MIRVNEREVDATGISTVGELRDQLKPDADILILNGFPVSAATTVKPGDAVALIRRGEQPSSAELETLMAARHTPGVHAKLKTATVGICGVGGLGTVVATALARIGVGRLILVDHDVVEPSNLNRQQYFVDQIGEPKVSAMAANLRRINPYVVVQPIQHFLTRADYPTIFASATVMAECFDTPTGKADCFAVARTTMKTTPWVMVSGLAGFASSNLIRVRQLSDNVWLVGDETHAAQIGRGLMAPRVTVAAGMQANAIVQLILDDPAIG